ncbi:MAG: AMIN domain-containing protein [Pseudomonadota bacterium]
MGKNKNASDTNASPPENLRRPLQTSVPVTEARNLAKPANSSDGFSGSATVDLSDAISPMGLKTPSIFEEEISNNDARFDRLENVVSELHTEFKTLKPSINKLVSVENDLNDLMDQLDVLINETPIQPRSFTPPKPMAAKAQANQKPVAITPEQEISKASTNVDRSKAILHNLRLADHKGKTRLVIETTQHLPYTANLDKSENLLTVSFDKGKASFNPASLSKKSKLVKTVTVDNQGNASLVIIELTKPIALGLEGRVKPNKDNSYHRIFIDLMHDQFVFDK